MFKMISNFSTSVSSTSFFNKFMIVFISYFTPISGMVHVMLIFLVIDTISGIWASLKSGEKLESGKLRRTVYKFLWYTIAVMASRMMEKTFHMSWSNLAGIIAGFICFVELKSIFENITKITNEPIFMRILNIFRKKSTETISDIMDDEDDLKTKPNKTFQSNAKI